MTDQHPKQHHLAIPILTMDGQRIGHVYPTLGPEHVHWGTVDSAGYLSPFLHPTARDAAERLLERAGAADCGRHIDTRLTGPLARLGEEFGPLGVALAAAYLTDPAVVVARLSAAPQPEEKTPAPEDRTDEERS